MTGNEALAITKTAQAEFTRKFEQDIANAAMEIRGIKFAIKAYERNGGNFECNQILNARLIGAELAEKRFYSNLYWKRPLDLCGHPI